MQIKNLTPHAVNIVDDDGREIVTFPATGTIARCKADTVKDHDVVVDGVSIAITKTEMGEVYDLPDQEEDVLLIVSMLVAKACPDRDDLVIPNEAVRDEQGRIVGCKSLGRV